MPSHRTPILINNIKIQSNVILAPMSGITDFPFRKIVREISPNSLVVSEMIATHGFLHQGHKTVLRSNVTDSMPQGSDVQLAGRDPHIIAEVAKMNVDNGAQIIDLNFGCPAKKVTNGFAGSALMKDELLASKILKTVVEAVNVPVTMKMRMGWSNENLNAPRLAKIAEESGIQMLTVHGRTRNQFYSGKANWKFIRTVKESVSIPVIANGDIVDFDSMTQALEDSNANGVMVGRAAYGNPWIIERLNHFLHTGEKMPEPSIDEKFRIIKKHLQYIIEFYGEEHGAKLARKHINWYIAGLPNASKARVLINKATSHNGILDLLDQFYHNIKTEDLCG